ncbi:MAG: hypothetical protein NXI31_14010 [bacterium]|nr:hypothetical protein [bacterium]
MSSRFLLWDFGDTLVDQEWMLAAPDDVPEWTACWRDTVRGELADSWFRGDVTAADIADRMAGVTTMSPAAALTHMQDCCRHVRFFMGVLDLAQSTELRQAIVTINPDLFSQVLAPHFRLERDFEVVVTSWEERSLDKVQMCRTALSRLDPEAGPSDGMLIDNLADNVAAWQAAGGAGHTFGGQHGLPDLRAAVTAFAADPHT